MAFGKKDNKASSPAAAADEAPVAPAAELAPAGGEAPPQAADAPLEPSPETTAETPAATDGGNDLLLSVFQGTQVEAEDITLLLDIAGDVAIDDLLEQLHTVAAALGIETNTAEDYEELAA